MELIVVSTAQLESIVARAVGQALAAAASGAANAATVTTDLLNVKDAAKRLHRSEKTIRDYIRLGLLTAVNFNAGTPMRPSYGIRQADLDAFVKAKSRR